MNDDDARLRANPTGLLAERILDALYDIDEVRPSSWQRVESRVAAVLADPNLAIIELPDPDPNEPGVWKLGRGIVAARIDGMCMAVTPGATYTPAEARAFAAALLAAARKAES